MNRRTFLAGCCTLLGLAAPAFSDDSPKPDIARLIEQLGSKRFKEREAAAKALEKMDKVAIPALRRAAKQHADAEVRRRAAALLARLDERHVGEWVRMVVVDRTFHAPRGCDNLFIGSTGVIRDMRGVALGEAWLAEFLRVRYRQEPCVLRLQLSNEGETSVGTLRTALARIVRASDPRASKVDIFVQLRFPTKDRQDALANITFVLVEGGGWHDDEGGFVMSLSTDGQLADRQAHPIDYKDLKSILNPKHLGVFHTDTAIIDVLWHAGDEATIGRLRRFLAKVRKAVNPKQKTVVYLHFDVSTDNEPAGR